MEPLRTPRRPSRALQPDKPVQLGRVAGRPVVASGDFHRVEHLSSWKTLLPCLRGERAVIDYLRSPAPAHLLPFRAEIAEQAAA